MEKGMRTGFLLENQPINFIDISLMTPKQILRHDSSLLCPVKILIKTYDGESILFCHRILVSIIKIHPAASVIFEKSSGCQWRCENVHLWRNESVQLDNLHA